ncbi:pre-mRNA-splicing factor Cwc25p [Diutina catenulata]
MAGDLNLKKSWNPALVKNQQKVWEKEQAKLDEYKQIKERDAEFEDEQQYAKLINIRYGTDYEEKITAEEKRKLNKLDWMYQGKPEVGKATSVGLTEMPHEFNDGKAQAEQLLSGPGRSGGLGGSTAKRSGERFNKIITGSKGSIDTKDDPMAMVAAAAVSKRSRDSGHRNHTRDQKSDRHSGSRHRRDRTREHRRKSHRSGKEEDRTESSRKREHSPTRSKPIIRY